MIDDALIQGVQKITNYRIKKKYPLMDDNHYSEHDVKWILESLAMILEEWNGNKRCEKTDREKTNKKAPPITRH